MTPEIKMRIDQIRRGKVPKGYRKTIWGIAPTSWLKRYIGEICTITSESTPRRNNPDAFKGSILWVTSGELKTKYLIDTLEKITEDAVKLSNLIMYEPGTVVIALYGLEAAGVRGTVSIIGKKCTISQACMAFAQFNNVLNEYFYYWYVNHGQVIGLRYAQGTKQQNLSTEVVRTLPVDLPDINEQEKIIKILSLQDKLIELKERRLAEKQQQKKYLMQQLLTGKKRLPGFRAKWSKKRLHNIAKRIIRKNDVQNKNVLTISAQYGLISQTEFFNKSIASDDKSNYFLLYRDNFAYNKSYSNGYPDGAIKRLTMYDNGIVSPLYICFQIKSEDVSVDYMEQFFEAGLMNHEIQAFAQEGARNHGLLNIATNDFFNSKVALPSIEEQKAIAKILTTADHEIDLLRKDIDQEKQKKKALMQLLLTGIVRVTV